MCTIVMKMYASFDSESEFTLSIVVSFALIGVDRSPRRRAATNICMRALKWFFQNHGKVFGNIQINPTLNLSANLTIKKE